MATEHPRACSSDRTLESRSSYGQRRISDDQSYERRETVANVAPASRLYSGFPSEAHYLKALREWAEEQKYVPHDAGWAAFWLLRGTTMQEYASRPP